MKTKLIHLSLLASLTIGSLFAQEKTTVTAKNSDISDNLDLRAVATVFGDASNLEDFERRLNDPKTQISNLDLNNDNYVDYLRVIETVEGNVHLVVVQAVLEKDVFQDVATIEVERDSNNRVQVQVVGDVYMYGTNYIYEPVYVHTPIIYNTFWVGNYRPYYSSWYWGYYPSYYSYWNPFPIFRYRNHIHVHINFGHSYHYVSHRRCASVYNNYYGRRGNGYERMHPNRSFAHRNSGYSNRHELDSRRNINTPRNRSEMTSNSPRGNRETREFNGTTPRTRTETSTPRNNGTRGNSGTRVTTENRGNSPRVTTENRDRNQGIRSNGGREYSENRSNTPRERGTVTSSGNRGNSETRGSSSRGNSQSRSSAPRGDSNSRESGSRAGGRG
ncbi:hypothetical protein [Flavobacterium cheniae]|uniref:DUF3300 domain-containing protein n=1 Tax=Flavobacterium cheniae TaxID=295428 RepID=A0A562KJ44_9FLAO|nr:hypothetical protein [Flavobacterium cheniae]TDR25765.1 hypothetical protein C8D80_0552 [Flavobacterium cheniae]TWH95374.1 hypothetical protein IP97_01048 [Flavobacterium cheniae]